MQRKAKRADRPAARKSANRKSAGRIERAAVNVEAVEIEPAAVAAVVETIKANHQMNTIEIDPQSLEAEALAALADAPPAPLAPGEEAAPPDATPEELRQGYEVLFTGLIGWSAQTFAPNWAVQPEETSALAVSLSGAFVLWFPDQPIPAKYLALVTVVAATAQIVAARRDPKTGVLRPLHVPEEKPAIESKSAVTSKAA